MSLARFSLGTTWQLLLMRWTDWLVVTGAAVGTVRSYRRRIVNFLADTGLELQDVTSDDLVAYVASLPAQGSARSDMLRAWRSYGKWLEGRGEPNPAAGLAPKNPKYLEAPYLEEVDLARFVFTLACHDPRRAWVALLIYGTGGRIAAVCALRSADVEHGRVHFRYRVKGDRVYSVRLNSVSEAAVEALADEGMATLVGVTPTRVRQWFDRANRESGLHVWPHLLRHCFASRLADDPSVDLRTWIALMGHSDASQFVRYASRRDDREREAMERFA